MSGQIRLLDVVALTEDVPSEGRSRGDVGAVVEVFNDGEAFEVEFCNREGETTNLLALRPSQLLRLGFDTAAPEHFATAS